MKLNEMRPDRYQGWLPDGREIFVYKQYSGTARVVVYGQCYPGNQRDQAY